jgi:hypothetical protein
MGETRSTTTKVLGYLLIIELVLFLIGGVVVTNMDSFWMRLAVWSLPIIIYITGAIFLAVILVNQKARRGSR